jgi:hypothetical protein
MNNLVPKPASRYGLTIWMIVSQLLILGSLGTWGMLAVVSIVFNDDPNSSHTSDLFMLAIWSYPIFAMGMSLAMWVAYAWRKNKLALILSLTTVLTILFCWGWLYWPVIVGQ